MLINAIAGVAFETNNANFAKRHDSLQTYRITAISGDRDELFEIFSLHMTSSQRSPWKRHDSSFYLRISRSMLSSIVVAVHRSDRNWKFGTVYATNRIFARRTKVETRMSKLFFFLNIFLDILINTLYK